MRKNVGKIFLMLLCLVGIGLFIIILWRIWRRLRRHPILTGFIATAITLTLVCLALYTFRTIEIEQSNRVVDIKDAAYYQRQSFIGTKPYFEYKVVPTELTKPDTEYTVVLQTNLLTYVNKLSWTDLELGIKKPMVIGRNLSEDEWVALNQFSFYKHSVTTFIKENNTKFLILPIAFLSISLFGYFLYLEHQRNEKRKAYQKKFHKKAYYRVLNT